METLKDQITRVVDALTKDRYDTPENLISYSDSPDGMVLTIDTWKDRWANIGSAVRAIDRLATVFKKADLRLAVKDQPTGPAKDETGFAVSWDNRPVLTVTLPKETGSLRGIDEGFGYIKFGGKVDHFAVTPG